MRKPALTRSRNKDTPVSRKTQLDFLVGGLLPTSRIKTVRAGARDCPPDNPLSKRAESLNLSQDQALFLYIVAISFLLLRHP